MNPIDRLLEEIWLGTELGASVSNLRHTEAVLDDAERYLKETRAAIKGLLRDKDVDISLYSKEQEMKGDLIWRCVHSACGDLQMARNEVNRYRAGHRRRQS
jgi:hypothetical protein